MYGQRGRLMSLFIGLCLAASFGACGGSGGGGSDDGGTALDAIDAVEIDSPNTVSLTFDDQSFTDVAAGSDGEAVAASVNLALGSTQLFAVVRDGADALDQPNPGMVRTSSVTLSTIALGEEVDFDRFEVDYKPESTGDGSFLLPGVWSVMLNLPGSGSMNFLVQFRDAGGTPTKNFGSTTTDEIEIRSDKSEITFFDLDVLSITDASWTLTGIRDHGDIVTVNAHGEVELDLGVPVLDDQGFEFTVTNLKLDFTDPDSFRRPEAGTIDLKVNDVVPVIGEDFEAILDFTGGNDATVTVDGICDLEFQWDLGNGLPEELEIRNCLE